MQSFTSCLGQNSDAGYLLVAALVCIAGTYASYSLTAQAVRTQGAERRKWALQGLAAAGCTAWAAHMLGLMAFRPGTESAFEPVLTTLSLLSGMTGIGLGTYMAIKLKRPLLRFSSGLVVGVGVALLHYLGQLGYVVRGRVEWDLGLVAGSLVVGLIVSGLSLVTGGSRNRLVRRFSPPMLVLSIAVIHFPGMAAVRISYDPRITLPADAVPAMVVAPVVAGISLWLVAMAFVGLRLSREASARLRRDRERVRELSAFAVEGLIVTDGQVVLTANPSLERICGAAPGALEGTHLHDLLPELDVNALAGSQEHDAALRACDGVVIPVRLVHSEVGLGDTRRMVLAVRDQRDRLRMEAKLKTLAYNDQLTGLINRGRFYDLLSLQAASRRERDHHISVLMIDLDQFKPVNDLLGHAAGDTVLRITADRVLSALREGDILARLGGDEFVILQLDGGEEAACALAVRIIELLRQPMAINDQAVQIGASIGIALAPEHGDEPEVLLRNSDLALYAAKSDGKGVYRVFDPELDTRMQTRRRLEVDLRHAISDGELELHYQPLVEAGSGRLVGAEALVRWNHPERGQIPPGDFIGLAEETGLILPLGEWVLRKACKEAKSWPSGLSVSVNLSPAQFRDKNLATTVHDALADAGLPATRLELEITEGVLLAEEQTTLATLNALRNEGVHISMDDFGTGYSSLSYLRRFPFDKIKVDQSFVRQLPNDLESAAIVRAILAMGACLGMSTTVEGVETPEQLAFSAAEGCTFVQGFLVSRPLTQSAFRQYVTEHIWAKEPELA